MSFCVYVDRAADTNVPFYVGKGNQKRVLYVERNEHHANIVKKHGLQRKIVFETESEAEAFERECALIAELHTFVSDPSYNGFGCNYTPGGEGHVPSELDRVGRSERLKARWQDPESREVLSLSMRGKPKGAHTEEWKKNHSQKLKGRKRAPFTAETRAKMSAAQKGRQGKKGPMRSNVMKKKWKKVTVVDPSGVTRIFESQKEAKQVLARELQMSVAGIANVFVTRKSSYRGYMISYEER